jgi:hypothetical protein
MAMRSLIPNPNHRRYATKLSIKGRFVDYLAPFNGDSEALNYSQITLRKNILLSLVNKVNHVKIRIKFPHSNQLSSPN